MFDFFRSLFRPQASGALAKERLRLVLLSDHLALAPDVIDAMKADLLAVISKYVEIDEAHADVAFEHREHEIAMLASVPIVAVRNRRLPPEPAAAEPTIMHGTQGADAPADTPIAPPGDAQPPAAQPKPRRRRRRLPKPSMGEPAQA